MKNGFFITLEGLDGCGKSTQAVLLVKKLKKFGRDIVHTREPGGTIIAEAIRKVLLNPKSKIYPLAELFLYESCRAQHTEETIIPALKLGKIVVCERYIDATVAYQGFGRGLDVKMIMNLNKIATNNLVPDITIYFDADVKCGHARTSIRGSKDRLEKENLLFHKRVRDGYKWLIKKFPRRFKTVNADDPIEKVSECIFSIVKEHGFYG